MRSFPMLAMIVNVARSALPDGRPLPLTPTPVPLRSLTSGAVSTENFRLTPAQEGDFASRPHSDS